MTFPTQDHIDAAQRAADRLLSETGAYVWPSVSLAQAQLESANWTILSGDNNGFGLKATPGEIAAGQARLVWTHETINGSYIKVQQYFANFDSLEEAYYAHARLLATSPYYKLARSTSDPRAFANALTWIYATGIPGHPYGQALIAIMDAGNFYQFDRHGVTPQNLSSSIQAALNARGYHLYVDGDLGPASQGAIADFIAKHP